MKRIGYYKCVEIRKNVVTGNYYINSPLNGTIRIFHTLRMVREYLDNYVVLDSHAEALARNPW